MISPDLMTSTLHPISKPNFCMYPMLCRVALVITASPIITGSIIATGDTTHDFPTRQTTSLKVEE